MEATLIFPHQLFRPHPAVKAGRRIWLLEDPLYYGTDRHWPLRMHWQKLLLHHASLDEFSDELTRAGHAVSRITCPPDPCTTEELLAQALPKSVTSIHVVDPVDDVLTRRIKRWSQTSGVSVTFWPTPNFLTPQEVLAEHFSGGRKPFMARFYTAQRRRLGVLLEADGSPLGGRWSFDTENRKKLSRKTEVPPPPFPSGSPSLSETIPEAIRSRFRHAKGQRNPGYYPTTRRAARAWLKDFLTWRFHFFGAYEDAISVAHPVLFHSVLTPTLNIGLLDPKEVIDAALAAAEAQKIPLASLEGFVRQIIGWREFVRGAYEHRGVAMRRANVWGFTRRMPQAFDSATTGLEPVDQLLRGILASGWCHHIERLMILGSLFLLCRIHPDEVYRWFMETFVDAYDWVMVPNVYGMSQFSDGGSFTTKPYFSSSNYLLKMSDFKPGPWCDIWDALFWTFIADYEHVFAKNPRLSVLTLGLGRQRGRLDDHRRRATSFLEGLR